MEYKKIILADGQALFRPKVEALQWHKALYVLLPDNGIEIAAGITDLSAIRLQVELNHYLDTPFFYLHLWDGVMGSWSRNLGLPLQGEECLNLKFILRDGRTVIFSYGWENRDCLAKEPIWTEMFSIGIK